MSQGTVTSIAYTLRLVVRSPFLFEGFDPAGADYDACAIRDGQGVPIIPGSHVKGHFHHAMRALLGDGEVTRSLFGAESLEGTEDAQQDMPNRGNITFGDFAATGVLAGTDVQANTWRSESLATRVAIDDDTGAAGRGSLQIIELVALPGAEVVFEGTVRLLDADFAEQFEALVPELLKLIPAMGAIKTGGYGEVLASKCLLESIEAAKAVTDPGGERITVEAGFDGPLMVNTIQLSRNMFESATVVPGGVLKGALADCLSRAGLMSEAVSDALSKCRISHAYPVDQADNLCDRAIPSSVHSVLHGNDEHFADACLYGTGSMPQGLMTFPTDWKAATFEAARKRLSRPASELGYLPRGRVAIGQDGVAEDGNLFVQSMVNTQGGNWRFDVNMSGIGKAERETILSVLASGLDRVGKTDTALSVTDMRDADALPPAPTGERVSILLETPACLTRLDDEASLHDQYERYFREILGKNITLERFFAQRLPAGRYQAIRYKASDTGYLPFELTQAGGVFVLHSAQGFDARLLDGLQARGLPARVWNGAAFATPNWQDFPFLPENGYGEVTLGEGDAGLLPDNAKRREAA